MHGEPGTATRQPLSVVVTSGNCRPDWGLCITIADALDRYAAASAGDAGAEREGGEQP